MMTKLFLTAIALVIPVFFLLLFVMSSYHRLAALRRRCAQVAAEIDTVADPGKSAVLASELTTAIAAYNAARSAFPAKLVADLFGFPSEGSAIPPPDQG
jgi:hypothetical protein